LPAINSAKCDASANLLGIPQHQQQLKKEKKTQPTDSTQQIINSKNKTTTN
jgi:hypothetical protein